MKTSEITKLIGRSADFNDLGTGEGPAYRNLKFLDYHIVSCKEWMNDLQKRSWAAVATEKVKNKLAGVEGVKAVKMGKGRVIVQIYI